jgi:hypothetical protein
MLDALITSKTRIKLLLKFFLNPESNGYLRGLSTEFGESTNSIRIELNRLEEAGLLESDSNGNKKIFHANTKHPLFPDIQSIVRKYTGIDEVIEKVVKHLGDPREVYLVGDLAKGFDSDQIEILIVGNDIDIDYLAQLVKKAQKLIKKEIKTQVKSVQEFIREQENLLKESLLKVWTKSEP